MDAETWGKWGVLGGVSVDCGGGGPIYFYLSYRSADPRPSPAGSSSLDLHNCRPESVGQREGGPENTWEEAPTNL